MPTLYLKCSQHRLKQKIMCANIKFLWEVFSQAVHFDGSIIPHTKVCDVTLLEHDGVKYCGQSDVNFAHVQRKQWVLGGSHPSLYQIIQPTHSERYLLMHQPIGYVHGCEQLWINIFSRDGGQLKMRVVLWHACSCHWLAIQCYRYRLARSSVPQRSLSNSI